MRIGLDLDGVIYQFDKTAQYMIAKHRGLRLREQQDWDHAEYWRGVEQKEWDWLWEIDQTDSLFRHGHLYRGAIEFVHELGKLGRIVVVTKRPVAADAVTRQWLAFHFPLEVMEINTVHSGSKSDVDFDVLIDDLERNTAEARALGRYAILMDRPWNQNAAFYTYDARATTFEDVLDEIRRHDRRWEDVDE